MHKECEPTCHSQPVGSAIPVIIRMKSAHTCRYICELTPRGREQYICYCRRSSFQTCPLSLEFCRFSGGSKLSRSPRCRQSFSTDGTKIGIFSESCNICELFFLHLGAKLRRKGEMCKSFSVLFISFDTIIELLHKKRYADFIIGALIGHLC